jgi:hypothetical protein
VVMAVGAAQRRFEALRRQRNAARIARVLWAIWAVVVWNVVFDHVIVVAGRNYVYSAVHAAKENASSSPAYLVMDDWMRPAVRRAFWTATAAGGSILTIGLISIRLAASPARGSERNGVPLTGSAADLAAPPQHSR